MAARGSMGDIANIDGGLIQYTLIGEIGMGSECHHP